MAEKVRRLGGVIRERRKLLGWTLDELADAIGKTLPLTKSYLSNVERGYVNPRRGPVVPSDEALQAIARALGMPEMDLHKALGRVPENVVELDEFQTSLLKAVAEDSSLRDVLYRIAPSVSSDQVREVFPK